MELLSVKRVCAECGEKLPHEIKQIRFTKQNITEIQDLRFHFFLHVHLLYVAVGSCAEFELQ